MVLALLLWHCVTSIWDSNPWLVSHQFCSITSSAWMPLDSRGCAAHAVVRQHFIWWNCFSPPPPKCLTTGARRQPVRTARIMGGVESPVKTPSQGSPILLPSSRYFTSQCCVLIYNSESVYLVLYFHRRYKSWELWRSLQTPPSNCSIALAHDCVIFVCGCSGVDSL